MTTCPPGTSRCPAGTIRACTGEAIPRNAVNQIPRFIEAIEHRSSMSQSRRHNPSLYRWGDTPQRSEPNPTLHWSNWTSQFNVAVNQSQIAVNHAIPHHSEAVHNRSAFAFPPLHGRYPFNCFRAPYWSSLLRWRWATLPVRKGWWGGTNDLPGHGMHCWYRHLDVFQQIEIQPWKKKQFIWLGSRYQRQKVDITYILLGISEVKFQFNVNDLGVIIDDLLSMKDPVRRICRSSYYQLRQLWTVRKSLSMESCEALIHAFVSSRLDYCNSLLYGINKLQFDMLQSVLHASARLIFRKRKFDSISLGIRDKLHWLHVRKRIEFKICTTVYKCLHVGAPPYIPRWDYVASH